jgi:hypothetical protein
LNPLYGEGGKQVDFEICQSRIREDLKREVKVPGREQLLELAVRLFECFDIFLKLSYLCRMRDKF